MLFFDPMYFLIIAPGLLLSMWASWKVQSTFNHASQIPARSGYSGRDVAAFMLDRAGFEGGRIEQTDGVLSDHYVPGKGILRLSSQVYNGRSLAALGVAAHEAGHALQDHGRYPLLVLRNLLVPIAGFGSNAAWIILIIGFVLQMFSLVLIGLIAFSCVVLFQLINLPVEFDASRRARIALVDHGIVTTEEDKEVAKVLNAAALTYVAATLTSILTLLYFLLRSGILGGRN